MSGPAITISRKISSKVVCGDGLLTELEGFIEETGAKEMWLYMIYGFAQSIEEGESTYGPWMELGGEFRAISNGGEQFQSPACFLPEPAHSDVMKRMKLIGEPRENKKRKSFSRQAEQKVKFSYVIGVKLDEKSTTGYAYVVKDAVPAKVSDEMKELFEAATPDWASPAKSLPEPGSPGRKRKSSETVVQGGADL